MREPQLDALHSSARRAGLLDLVEIEGTGATLYAALNAPDALIFDDRAQAADRHMEYRVKDVPGLASGATVTVAGGRHAGRYRVTSRPVFDGERYFATVALERIRESGRRSSGRIRARREGQ